MRGVRMIRGVALTLVGGMETARKELTPLSLACSPDAQGVKIRLLSCLCR
jgi:hypothetical protein